MKKYKILNGQFIVVNGRCLYRIQALKDFNDVKKGEKGGYVEHYSNLSQRGTCWVYDDAKVYGNARVCGESRVYHNARIYGNAKVFDLAQVYGGARASGYARVYEEAVVQGSSHVYNKAQIYGHANVAGDARVFGNARVYGHAYVAGSAQIYGSSKVYGKPQVYGFARVHGKVNVCGNARVYAQADIFYGELTEDIQENLVQYIASSLNVYPINGKYYLYKRVNKIEDGVYASWYDKNFIYKDGEIAEVADADPDFIVGCGSGLYASTPFYWDDGDTLIAVEVRVEDIITCMHGEIRCRKLKVLGEVK